MQNLIQTVTNYRQLDANHHDYPIEWPSFDKWLKLVEKKQRKTEAFKNIIVTRQWLFYLWANAYSPLDALTELAGRKPAELRKGPLNGDRH